MKYKKVVVLLAVAALGIAGCEKGTGTASTKSTSTEEVTLSSSGHATVSTVDLTEGKYSEEKLDDSWDEKSAVKIKLDGDTVTADDENVEVDGSKVTITGAGTYVLSGTLNDGQIVVDSDDKDSVRLVLNGAEITCSSSSAIWVKDGDTIITLADGTENTLTDGAEYTTDSEDDTPKAAVYAKDDLTFNGTGSLTVNGNYKNGIQCKDALKFVSGTYTITAANNGLVGKDSVSVKDGTYTITSGGDGIKSTNTDETDKGYVIIDGGTFTITAEGDGIQAETLLRVNDGEFTITTGGGSANAVQKNEMGGGDPMGNGGPAPGSDGQAPGNGGELPEMGQKPEDGQSENTDATETSDSTTGNADTNTPPEKKDPPQGNGGQPGEMPQNSTDNLNSDSSQTSDGSGTSDSNASDSQMQPGGTPPDQNQQSIEEEDTTSTKGLKSYVELVAAGGTFNIDSCDDAFHSDNSVEVTDGTYTINTGDDGIHADKTLNISGGTIDIQKCYEGIEGFDIVIDDGDIRITASDDAINAAGKSEDTEETAATDGGKSSNDSETTSKDTLSDETKKSAENTGDSAEEKSSADDSDTTSESEKNTTQVDDSRPDPGNGPGGGQPGQMGGGGMEDEDQGATLTINGGNIYVNANGDGLDANGDILITGGNLTLHGPEDGGNGTLDYASECKITGGTFAAVGSNGMIQNPSEDSEQPVICKSLDTQVESGTVIAVKDENGKVITEITTEKKVQWYAFSSSKFKVGKTYTICVGDQETEVTLESNYTEL